MKIFEVLSVIRSAADPSGRKEYRYYFSCYRKALAFVASDHCEEYDDHGAIYSMLPNEKGKFVVDECLKTW